MKSMLKLIMALAVIGLVTGTADAAISITNLTQGYTQDFNTAPIPSTTRDAWTWTDNSTFEGWYRRANVNNGVQTPDPELSDYTAKAAGVTIDGFYNAHANTSSDAALGFLVDGLPGGLKKGSLGIVFTNETGSTIESFDVSYRGEQWYRTTTNTTLKFQWMVTNSFADISSDIDRAGVPWKDSGALDWDVTGTNVTFVNGSLPANGTNLSNTVNNNVNLADGQVLILRWRIPLTGYQQNGLFIDDVVITNFTVAPPDMGDPAVVFFGGDADIFDGDVETNNMFVAQTDAGEIVQWNGVNSDGGGFGASGTLNGVGVGASLTNAANNLILTTVDIAPSGGNTFSSGSPNLLGITDNKFNSGLNEAWTFEFNKPIQLKQLVLAGLAGDARIVKVTVDGVDTNSFTRLDANITNVVWEGSPANKYVYTYSSPVVVPAGTDITIESAANVWSLQGIVVDATFTLGSLTLIDFGGNPDLITNSTYQAEMGGDAVIAWWGGDDEGRFLGSVGTLKDQGVGGTLSSVKYELAMTTLAITSTNAARTNTVVVGGQLGVNFAGSGNASFEATDGDPDWTFELDKNAYLTKASFKGFTVGSEEAEIIIGGVTNLITPADCDDATFEVSKIYTFASPVFVSAGTQITVRAPVGKWGLANLLFGLENAETVNANTYLDRWITDFPGLGVNTNLTDNPDSDTALNLYEYAMGGDPTDGGDIGNLPGYQTFDEGGTNFFDYVYLRRSDADARGLLYELELNDDLVLGSWTNVGYEVIEGPFDGDFRNVTNRVDTTGKPELFFRLNVEFQ